jgi:hypothetical protein
MREECSRLWREHGAATDKIFRLEERLRRAQLCQDNDLANALTLTVKVTYVAREITARGRRWKTARRRPTLKKTLPGSSIG